MLSPCGKLLLSVTLAPRLILPVTVCSRSESAPGAMYALMAKYYWCRVLSQCILRSLLIFSFFAQLGAVIEVTTTTLLCLSCKLCTTRKSQAVTKSTLARSCFCDRLKNRRMMPSSAFADMLSRQVIYRYPGSHRKILLTSNPTGINAAKKVSS